MAVAGVIVAGAVAGGAYFSLRAQKPLAYDVLGGYVSEGGYVAGATLHFSDGTQIAFPDGGRGRLAAVDASGARLALESGRVSARAERADTRWSIDVGPFVVHFGAAELEVAWSGSEGLLDVAVRHGSATVSGPPTPAGLGLRAGQRLVAHEGHLRVEAIDRTEPATDGAGSASAQSPSTEPGAAADTSSWPALVERGEHQTVLAEAEQRDLESCYAGCNLADLIALADAARMVGRMDVAQRSLEAQRARFPSSAEAKSAAFLLGRLAEDTADDARAVEWYDHYLREAPEGLLAAEALDRKMTALMRLGRVEQARQTAHEYLQSFGAGPNAARARELAELQSP